MNVTRKKVKKKVKKKVVKKKLIGVCFEKHNDPDEPIRTLNNVPSMTAVRDCNGFIFFKDINGYVHSISCHEGICHSGSDNPEEIEYEDILGRISEITFNDED